MYQLGDTEHLNRSRYSLPAIATRWGALLSLSWYSSVPFGWGPRLSSVEALTTKPKAGAHLTLSRVSAPRYGGGPSFRARVWLASRRWPAGPLPAWRAAYGNGSRIRALQSEI